MPDEATGQPTSPETPTAGTEPVKKCPALPDRRPVRFEEIEPVVHPKKLCGTVDSDTWRKAVIDSDTGHAHGRLDPDEAEARMAAGTACDRRRNDRLLGGMAGHERPVSP